MKHIPDQAEKLRQLAARETSPDTPDDAALATLDTLAEELAQSSTAPASPATVSSPVPTRSEKEVDPGSAPRQTQPQTETLSASPKAPAPQETPAPRPAVQTVLPPPTVSPTAQPVVDPPKALQIPEAPVTPQSSPSPSPLAENNPVDDPQERPQRDKISTDRGINVNPELFGTQSGFPDSGSPSLFLKPKPARPEASETLEADPVPARIASPAPEPSPAEPPAAPHTETIDALFTTRRFPMESHTQVIAITGGKGGVGKSNIACNLGLAIAEMNKRVMLLDADLSLANLDVLMGITPRFNLSHLLSGEKTLQDIMIQGPRGISIIPGGSGVEELANIPAEKMERVFDAFATFHPAPDVLIVDTAAGIHPNVIQFLMAADQTIVVTTPEPTAYTDAYALIKTIIKYDPHKEIGVLINMVHNNAEAVEVLKLLLQICRQMLNTTFHNIGSIPRDPAVLKAVRFQKPFILSSPNTLAAQAIRRIAATIMQIDKKDKNTRGLGQFLRRLFTGYAPPSQS